MKTIYINAMTVYNAEWDLKTLIPDANMRRRMSRFIKMGVATGLKCLQEAGVESPDSIITATAYGCLADSEKFLSSALASDEQMLPPTPFIQSTFNTMGSQIAILTGCHGYNMTFVDRQRSFADALVDACLEIGDGKQNVLLGYADEMTPTLGAILNRMGRAANNMPHEDCAWFFLLSDVRNEHTLAALDDLSLSNIMGYGSVHDFIAAIR